MPHLTAGELKGLLRYDADSGQFECASTGLPPTSHRTNGYTRICLGAHGVFYAHRLAWLYMTGAFPAVAVDHADNARSNNRWSNLRTATVSQNAANSRRCKNNTTGVKGVTRYLGKFRAQISIAGKRHWLGDFQCIDSAEQAYAVAATKAFGAYARLS